MQCHECFMYETYWYDINYNTIQCLYVKLLYSEGKPSMEQNLMYALLFEDKTFAGLANL